MSIGRPIKTPTVQPNKTYEKTTKERQKAYGEEREWQINFEKNKNVPAYNLD